LQLVDRTGLAQSVSYQMTHARAHARVRARSNALLLNAIGRDGLAIFKSFYDDARPEPSHWHGCAMTGNFADLPVDLCQCVVTCLLASDVACEWRDVYHFLLTCRGATAAVTRAHRFEAAARSYMLGALKPLPHAPAHSAYTELFYCFVRSHIAFKNAMDTFALAVSHCADLACCQRPREEINASWRREDWWQTWGSLGCAIVREALGAQSPASQISVAASKNAYPLCQTDRGVAVAQHGHTDGAKGVLCIERERCDVFSPDRELKVAFEVPTNDFVYLAASSGTLLALIVMDRLGDDDVPVDTYADEVAERSSDDGVLQVWDMATGECLLKTGALACTHELWVAGENVFCCMQTLYSERPNLWPLRVRRVSARDPHNWEDHALGNCCVIRDTCVARHTGDLALLDGHHNQDGIPEHLIFYDARRAKARVIDSHALVNEDRRSLVRMSPVGNTIAVLCRSCSTHSLVIYRREEGAGVGECPHLGWSRWKRIEPCCGFPDTASYTYIQGAFSPCGGKLVYFCRGEVVARGEVITVNVRAVLKGHERAVTATPILHATIPHDTFVWDDNGFYLPTGTRGGVLCIGT